MDSASVPLSADVPSSSFVVTPASIPASSSSASSSFSSQCSSSNVSSSPLPLQFLRQSADDPCGRFLSPPCLLVPSDRYEREPFPPIPTTATELQSLAAKQSGILADLESLASQIASRLGRNLPQVPKSKEDSVDLRELVEKQQVVLSLYGCLSIEMNVIYNEARIMLGHEKGGILEGSPLNVPCSPPKGPNSLSVWLNEFVGKGEESRLNKEYEVCGDVGGNVAVAMRVRDRMRVGIVSAWEKDNLECPTREIDILKEVGGKNFVVPLLDSEIFPAGVYFLVLPLFPDNENVGEEISGDAETRRKCIWQLLKAVEHCHNNGVIHGKISQGVLLYHPNSSLLTLADFSHATNQQYRFPPSNLPFTHYFAPELLEDPFAPFTAPADIWSIGIVLAEWALHQRLCFGDNRHTLLSNLNKFHDDLMCPHGKRLGSGWAAVDEEEKNFIWWLLNRPPSLRPSASTALGHPYFAGLTQEWKDWQEKLFATVVGFY